MQGKDRQIVQSTAEQLGLEGSFIPRTYIEQIQLEKLINEVMVWFSVEAMIFFLYYVSFGFLIESAITGPTRRFEEQAKLRWG